MAVAVADRLQGRGIGRALTAASLDWAEHHGIDRLRATMLADNTGIVRLLQSLRRPLTFTTPAAGVVEAVVQVAAGPARAA
jgi:GNAT superfamily N-acetyltransferase